MKSAKDLLYVRQSLNPNEEIICTGEFHWIYTFNAAMWIVIGIGFMVGIIYAGYYWEVSRAVSNHFQGLPDHLATQAWEDIVARKGGFVQIVSNMHIGIKIAAFISLIFGIFSFLSKIVTKATTEICITSDRLVIKRGVVARHIEEMSIDRIEGVDVTQGILGRILDYGMIAVRGMGVGEMVLPPVITNPVGFRKALETASVIKRENI